MNNTADLKTLTVKELLTIAKGYDIKGRHDMTKVVLISAIEAEQKKEAAQAAENTAVNAAETSDKPEETVNDTTYAVAPECAENVVQTAKNVSADSLTEKVVYLGESSARKPRSEYIDKLQIGQIIVFDVTENVTLSAKVIEISKNTNGHIKHIICETRRGKRYRVPASKILWVKTSKRYPKGIFEKLIKRTTNSDSDKQE